MEDLNNNQLDQIESRNEELKEQTIKAMGKVKEKDRNTLELSPEQMVYMIKVMARKMADKETELAAAHAAVACQSDWIKSLLETIQIFKVRLGARGSQEAAAEFLDLDKQIEGMIQDDLAELREDQRTEQQQTPLEPITADPYRDKSQNEPNIIADEDEPSLENPITSKHLATWNVTWTKQILKDCCNVSTRRY